MKNYKTITHNRYTAELVYRDNEVKLSGLSNIQWNGSSNVAEALNEYSEFLSKVANAAKEFKVNCLLSELEEVIEYRASVYGV